MSRFSPEEIEAIRLIDQRQGQLLEGLDALNVRIVALLKDYGVVRAEDEQNPSSPIEELSVLDPAA